MIPRTVKVVVLVGIVIVVVGVGLTFYGVSRWEEFTWTEEYQKGWATMPYEDWTQASKDLKAAWEKEIVYPYRQVGLIPFLGGFLLIITVAISYQIAKEVKQQ